MSFDASDFGMRLRKLRESQELTQAELAERLHISMKYVSILERGLKTCSVDLLVDIADYFGTSLDYLALGSEAQRAESKIQILEVINRLTEIAQNM